MTDPIRLIVSAPGPETGSMHYTVLIHPAIARQIVALGQGVVPLHAEFEKRIAALESILIHNVKRVLDDPDPTMQEQIRQEINSKRMQESVKPVDTHLFVGGAGLAPLQTQPSADKPALPPGDPELAMIAHRVAMQMPPTGWTGVDHPAKDVEGVLVVHGKEFVPLKDLNDAHVEIADLRAKLAAWKKQAECERDAADEAEAELAALKARKVKLPEIDMMQNRITQYNYRIKVIEAIKAAGVEVE